MAGSLQLHAGEETRRQSVAIVDQLCGEHRTGFLWVDDGGALEALWPMAWLELQLCLVVAPGAVRHSHNSLPAVFKALAPWLQGHVLNEVAV